MGLKSLLMKRPNLNRHRTAKRAVTVGSDHPLVGTWVEEGNPFNATTVVYTITAQDGHFCVSGVDESDEVILSITKTSWDGEELHFVSLFPPTNHISNHAFLLTGGWSEPTVT